LVESNSRSMKADKNAAGTEKRSTKAFYPELAERKGSFDLLHLLQKAEPAVPQHKRFDDNGRRTSGENRKAGTLSKRLEKPHSHSVTFSHGHAGGEIQPPTRQNVLSEGRALQRERPGTERQPVQRRRAD
jgi:hypothetical protein